MRLAVLATWRMISGGNDGPIVRLVGRHGNIQPDRLQADAVSTIPRDHLIGAGISPEGYSGHFLRAGLATSTIRARVPTYKILAQTGQASDLMLARYVRDAGCSTETRLGCCCSIRPPMPAKCPENRANRTSGLVTCATQRLEKKQNQA